MSFDKNQSGENFERNSEKKIPGGGHFSKLYDSIGKIGSTNTEEEIRTLRTEVEPYKIILAAAKEVPKPVKVEGDLDVDAIADARLKAIAIGVNEMDDGAKRIILAPVYVAILQRFPILKSDLENDSKKKKFEEVVTLIETEMQRLVTTGGISQSLADQLKSKDTEEARVIANMLAGYMPEGYVLPDSPEDVTTNEEMSEEYKEMLLKNKSVYRGGLFERMPAPKLSLEGIKSIDPAAIQNQKIAAIAAFLVNSDDELLNKWVELIGRYHKVSQELDTREPIKSGGELYGRVHSFMMRWNNVYGSDPNLHLDTVEEARDVINLFAGKTPERLPHEAIEDEREREFYANQKPPEPPAPRKEEKKEEGKKEEKKDGKKEEKKDKGGKDDGKKEDGKKDEGGKEEDDEGIPDDDDSPEPATKKTEPKPPPATEEDDEGIPE